MADYAELIPVNVLSGFLGSGKTTLLRRLLTVPELPETAVLINEFGEVGLDHKLLQPVTETTLLLDNGCLCCAMRGDLQQALRALFSQRERGEIPRFQRVVIEASGLADPAPIAYTLLVEPVLQHHFRLGNIITVVDAVNGAGQLREFPEALKQAALADRLVISKTDLVDRAVINGLQTALRHLNAAAPVYRFADIDPRALLLEDIYTPEARAREVQRWLGSSAGHETEHRHTQQVSSFSLRYDAAMDWTAFGVWLTMLLNRYGDQVLRVKGILNVAGLDAPVLINAVQHMVHPPTHLDAWPDQERCSRLVFIVRDLERERLEASLAVFNALGKTPT